MNFDPRKFWLVYAIGGLSLGITSMFNLLIPLWALKLAAPVSAIGAIVAIGSVAPAILAIPAGAICDRLGARRVLLVSAVGTIVSGLLFGMANSYVWLIWIQLWSGLFRTTAWMAAQTYITQIGEGHDRTTRVGYFSFAANAGVFIGPIAVGAAAEFLGYTTAFMIASFCAIILAVCASFLPALTITSTTNSWRNFFNPRDYLDATRLLLVIGIPFTIFSTFYRLFIIGITDSFYPVYLQEILLLPETKIGILLSVGALFSTIIIPFTGILTRRYSKEALLAIALIAGVIGLSITPALGSFSALLVAILAYGFCIGITQPLIMALLADYTSPAQRGLIVGLRTTVNRIASMASPMLLGSFTVIFSFDLAFYITGLISMLAILLAFWSGQRQLRNAKQATHSVPDSVNI